MKCFALVFSDGHVEIVKCKTEAQARQEAREMIAAWERYGTADATLKSVQEIVL